MGSDSTRLGGDAPAGMVDARGTGVTPGAQRAGAAPADMPSPWAANRPAGLALPVLDEPAVQLLARLAAARPVFAAEAAVNAAAGVVVAEAPSGDRIGSARPAPHDAAALDAARRAMIAAEQDLTAARSTLARGVYGIPPGAAPDGPLDIQLAAEMQALVGLVIADFAAVEAALDAARRGLIDSLVARYASDAARADLAIATAAHLAAYGGVKFGFGHAEQDFDPLGAPVPLFGVTRVVRSADESVTARAAEWSPLALPDAALVAFAQAPLHPDALRQALYLTHPAMAVMAPVYRPSRLGQLVYKRVGETAQSVGGRLTGILQNWLTQEADKLRLDPAKVRADARLYSMAAPVFALVRQRLIAVAGTDALDLALDRAIKALQPPGFSTYDLVMMAAGVGILMFSVATFGSGAGAMLAVVAVAGIDLALSGADAQMAVQDWELARKLAAAEQADAVFEVLDPRLDSIEGAPSTAMAMGFAALSVLALLPVAGDFLAAARRVSSLPAVGRRSRRGAVMIPYPAARPKPAPPTTAPAFDARTGAPVSAPGGDALAARAAPFDQKIAQLGLGGVTGQRVVAVIDDMVAKPPLPKPGQSLNAYLFDFYAAAAERLPQAGIPEALVRDVAEAVLVGAYGDETARLARMVEALDEDSDILAEAIGPLGQNNPAAQRGLSQIVAHPPLTPDRAFDLMRAALDGPLPPSRVVHRADGHYTFKSVKSTTAYSLPKGTQITFTSRIEQITDPASPFYNTVVVTLTGKRTQFEGKQIEGWMDLMIERYRLANESRAAMFAEGTFSPVQSAAQMRTAERNAEGFLNPTYELISIDDLDLAVDEVKPLAELGLATPDNQMLLPGALNGLLAKMDTPQITHARLPGQGPVWVSWVRISFE